MHTRKLERLVSSRCRTVQPPLGISETIVIWILRVSEPLRFDASAEGNSVRGSLDRTVLLARGLRMNERISEWESEGGSLNETSEKALTGSINQVDWARQIRTQVNAEFDRVIAVLQAAAANQSAHDRMDTQAIIKIAEEKRTEVMEHQNAGYFIHDWQELRDQVRQMIMKDDRFKAIKAGRVRL